MKKTTISAVTIITFAISLYILVFEGFGFPNISPRLGLALRVLAALCAQIFVVCNFKATWIRLVPMIITALLALWGGVLFLAPAPGQNTAFALYFAEYADYYSPFLGCCAAWLIYKINFVQCT